MRYWYSPFKFEDTVVAGLRSLGLRPWSGALFDLPRDSLLVYDTPDRLWGHPVDLLLDGYKQLNDNADEHIVRSAWRLLGLAPEAGAIERAFTYALNAAHPTLFQNYFNLELRAVSHGDDPDAQYAQRLAASLDPRELLNAWNKISQICEDARAEAFIAASQLQQVQSELEKYFMLSRSQRRLIRRHQHLAVELIEALAPAAAPFSRQLEP